MDCRSARWFGGDPHAAQFAFDFHGRQAPVVGFDAHAPASGFGTRNVRANPSGSSWRNFLICGPVKRSNAREPVVRARYAAPPTAAVICAHCAAVLASIQIGDTARENGPSSCGAIGCEGSREAQRGSASLVT